MKLLINESTFVRAMKVELFSPIAIIKQNRTKKPKERINTEIFNSWTDIAKLIGIQENRLKQDAVQKRLRC
jgi:subtilisin-like proprotein convertase family protein